MGANTWVSQCVKMSKILMKHSSIMQFKKKNKFVSGKKTGRSWTKIWTRPQFLFQTLKGRQRVGSSLSQTNILLRFLVSSLSFVLMSWLFFLLLSVILSIVYITSPWYYIIATPHINSFSLLAWHLCGSPHRGVKPKVKVNYSIHWLLHSLLHCT